MSKYEIPILDDSEIKDQRKLSSVNLNNEVLPFLLDDTDDIKEITSSEEYYAERNGRREKFPDSERGIFEEGKQIQAKVGNNWEEIDASEAFAFGRKFDFKMPVVDKDMTVTFHEYNPAYLIEHINQRQKLAEMSRIDERMGQNLEFSAFDANNKRFFPSRQLTIVYDGFKWRYEEKIDGANNAIYTFSVYMISDDHGGQEVSLGENIQTKGLNQIMFSNLWSKIETRLV